ncbi:MAG: hypothetical protein IKX02_01395, partial [Spirochaetales bacterium]|nr:hypothetical protein [Spirochaetales bacterium]
MKKRIEDVQIGDKIMGTDGRWHKVIGKTDPIKPYVMYEITFSNGKVKCSDTHQWNVYIGDKMYTIDAMAIEQEFEFYKDRHIGVKDGPTIVGI